MKAHNPRPFFRYEKNQFIVTGGGLLFSIHVMEEGQQLDTCEVSTRGTFAPPIVPFPFTQKTF